MTTVRLVDVNRTPMSRRHLYAALTHWSVVAVLMMAGALMMLSVPLAIAEAFFGVLGVVGVLVRREAFRKRVDARCERHRAAAVRVGLLERMSAAHRGELEQLDRLAVAIRNRCGGVGKGPAVATEAAVENWLELERLLSLYIQIAVAHRDATTSFPSGDYGALVVATEQVRATTFDGGGSTEACLRRRAAILQRRRETWTQALTERDLLAHELSTIADLVRWMHEICAITRGAPMRLEMERVLASWERCGDALHEVATLCRDDEEPLEPATLALGRDELARRAEVSRRLDAYTSNMSGGSARVPDAAPGLSVAGVSPALTVHEQSTADNPARVVALRPRPIDSIRRCGGSGRSPAIGKQALGGDAHPLQEPVAWRVIGPSEYDGPSAEGLMQVARSKLQPR